jgi:hypothetical protein
MVYFDQPRPSEGDSWLLQLASELTGGESWCFWVKKIVFLVKKGGSGTVHRNSIELGFGDIEFGSILSSLHMLIEFGSIFIEFT